MRQKSVISRTSKLPAIKIAPPMKSFSVLDKPPQPVLAAGAAGAPGAAGAETAWPFRPGGRAGAARGA